MAEAVCMDANNLVLLLNELEDAGYAERRRDPVDRRRHRVHITEAGLEVLARSEPAQDAIEQEVLQALDEDERATLWRLLARALQGAEPATDRSYDAAVETPV
jgi:DNA-binding MarR family transcriptional regulator